MSPLSGTARGLTAVAGTLHRPAPRSRHSEGPVSLKTLEKHPARPVTLRRTSVPPSKGGCRSHRCLFWRNPESDGSLLHLSGRHPLDQSEPLYTRLGCQGDVTDVPIRAGSCPQVIGTCHRALCSCWEIRTSSLVSRTCSVTPSPGSPLLLLFPEHWVIVALMYKFQ